MGAFGYIQLSVKGVGRLFLDKTLRVLALCSVGIVAIGCYRSDRLNENRDGKSDTDAHQYATVDAGSESDSRFDIDTALNPQNGNDSTIVRSPQHDAAPPNVIEITNQCGIVRRWITNDNVRNPVVIQGGDGLMVIKGSSSYDPDDDDPNHDLCIYNAIGQELGPFALDIVMPSSSESGSSLVGASKVGDWMAAIMQHRRKMHSGSSSVILKHIDVHHASGFESYTDFGALNLSLPGLPLYPYEQTDKRLLFVTIAPNDKLLFGIQTDDSSRLEMAWLATDINQSSERVNLSLDEILDVAVTGIFENPCDDSVSCNRSCFEVNERGQMFATFEQDEIVGEEGVESKRYDNRIYVYKDDFTLIGDYELPTDVRVRSIQSTEQGRLIIAGYLGYEEHAEVWYNMLAVDESGVVLDVWPEARIDGTGEAVSIDSERSGGFVLAGNDPAIDSPWLQRYDENGGPLWPQRVGGRPEDESTGSGTMSSISIQSDGSIFLSNSGDDVFVYCEE